MGVRGERGVKVKAKVKVRVEVKSEGGDEGGGEGWGGGGGGEKEGEAGAWFAAKQVPGFGRTCGTRAHRLASRG